MKKLFILLLIALVSSPTFAQKPEPVTGYAKVLKPVDWYRDQRKAWQAEIRKDSRNAFAWLNYYRATRTLNKLDRGDTASHQTRVARIDSIVKEMEKNVPGSFEYNFIRWSAGGNDFTLLPYLEKAYKIDPDRHELFDDMVNWGEIKDLPNLRDEYLTRWFQSGEMSPGILNYNYNVIAGLRENAILLTCGDNDTYPIWMLQAVQGVRKDVAVINMYLVYIKEYREKLFKRLGIKDLDYDISSEINGPWKETHTRHVKDLMAAIASNSQNRPLYMALTVEQDNWNFIADKLFLTGLAYEYRTIPFDNLAVLKNNFENRYALDYLDHDFVPDRAANIVKKVNGNYIVPLLKLHEHYKLSGDIRGTGWTRSLLLNITRGTEDEQKVLEHLAAK
jgi:hypothetical protein